MRTSKRVVLFCVLFLIFLSFKPLQAYDISLFSGLEVANSQNPPGAKVFAIKENSPPLQSDLRINDVITSIEGQTVSSLEDFVRISTALKDKESVSLSVHRWGKVFEIALGKKSVGEQAKPETRAQAEPPPKQAEVRTVQKGFANPVVPNATAITYRPGQYPSLGNNTHPGIDIVADCGSPIYAFADGQVTNLIKEEKDRNFDSLGYMIIIKHLEPINGKDTYSLYLHMKEPPTVSKGQTLKAGDVLGKIGDTGKADGCHVHFELRHFPDRFLNDKGWNYPLNIYGKGDQRKEKRFLENWEDPEVYFRDYPGGMVNRGDKPSKPETKKIAKGETIEDYFPIQPGARWEYQGKETSYEKSLKAEVQEEEPIKRVVLECKGKVSFADQEAVLFEWDTGEKEFVQLSGNDILLLGEEYESEFAADPPPFVYEPPLIKLRFPIGSKRMLNLSGYRRELLFYTGRKTPFEVEVTVEGKEEIKVPAGRFNAIKVKRKELRKSEEGEGYMITTEWYAKGVGLIRQEHNLHGESVLGEIIKVKGTLELMSYSATPTLVAEPEAPKVVKGDDTAKRGGSLKALLIIPIDLPEGFKLIKEEQINNETTAKEESMGGTATADEWLRMLESWGRINGYRRTLQKAREGSFREPQLELVLSDAEEYKTAKGATKAFQLFKKLHQSEEITKKLAEARGIKLLKFEIRKSPKCGDESFMTYLNGSVQAPIPCICESWQAVCRNNEILICITWIAYNTAIFESDVTQLVEKIAGRIK